MTILLYANYATSTLAFPVQPDDTTATLAAGTGTFFPQPAAGEGFYLTFQNANTGQESEIVLVTSIFGDTIMSMERHQQGTTAQEWDIGTIAAQYNTAGDMQNFIQAAVSGVTEISIDTANGFAGTSTTGATPVLTLSTTVGTSTSPEILKGNGTSISAATAGIDFAPPTNGVGMLYGNGTGGFSTVSVGSGLSFSSGTLSNTQTINITVDTDNGFAGTVTSGAINLTTDVSGMVKADGTALLPASAGTDYAAPPSGVSKVILANNGSGGFDNVTVSSPLAYDGTTKTLSVSVPVTSVAGDSPVSVSSLAGVYTVSMSPADSTNNGYLTYTDYNNFSGKAPAPTGANTKLIANGDTVGTFTNVTVGANLTYDPTTDTLSAAGAIGSISATTPISASTVSGATSISIQQADSTHDGYLDHNDFASFAGKQNALVSGTNIKSVNSNSLLGSGDLQVGTVTSVGLSLPAAFTVSNSPVVGTGTLTATMSGTTSQYLKGDGTLGTFPNVISTLNTLTAATQTFATSTGSTETDFTISSATATHTFILPVASSAKTGKLTNTDWITFNGKQAAYTNLSTIGALANATGWLKNDGSGNFSYSTPTAANVGAAPATTGSSVLTGDTAGGTKNATVRTWLTYSYSGGSPYIAAVPNTTTSTISGTTNTFSWNSSTTDMGLITSTTSSTTITILADSNITGTLVPVDGQKFIFRIYNNASTSAAVNIVLTTGSNYSFRMTSGISSTINLAFGSTLYIGCLWNDSVKRWDVIAAGST